MASQAAMTAVRAGNRGWIVTFAGTGINLALGVLYTWSVISKGVPAAWNWSETDKSLPYAIACLVFCLVMIPAGRMQDKIGPRIVATIGGVLVGAGLILASRTTSPLGYILGFGVLAGAGIGFGYASATPPAVKWFPAAKTGLIAGLGLRARQRVRGAARPVVDDELRPADDGAVVRDRISDRRGRPGPAPHATASRVRAPG